MARPSRSGRSASPRLDTPGHTPEHVAYAVADTARGGIRPCCSPAAPCSSAPSAGPTCSARSTRFRTPTRCTARSTRSCSPTTTTSPSTRRTARARCARPDIASTPTSTIGYEKRHNPLLHAADVEAFVQASPPRPAGRPAATSPGCGRRTRRGRRLLGGRVPEPRPLDLEETRRAIAAGALLLDLRRPAEHAVAHAPGSQSIPLGPSFGTWLGWVVDPDRPLVLILERPADWDEAIRQALRIGAEGAILGHLRGGFGTWADGGGPLESQRPAERRPARRAPRRRRRGGARSSSTSGRPTSTRSGTSRAAS